MKLIKQKDEIGCGVACVAMVAGVTYKQAKQLIFPQGTKQQQHFSTETSDLRRALKSVGVPVADKLVRVPKDIRQLKASAILKTNLRNRG